jgi:hypothetical protein
MCDSSNSYSKQLNEITKNQGISREMDKNIFSTKKRGSPPTAPCVN